MNLSERIDLFISGCRESDQIDGTVALELLEDCQVVIRRADDQFKSIASLTDSVDGMHETLDKLDNLSLTKVQI